jgi:hypothetical protein
MAVIAFFIRGWCISLIQRDTRNRSRSRPLRLNAIRFR